MPKTYKEGMYTMDAARRSALRVNFKKYLQAHTSANIRIKAITGGTEQWGVSADENVRTEILRVRFHDFTKSEVRRAYYQRTHQGVLAWRNRSRVLRRTYMEDLKKSKNKHPIAAHTPGIKTQVVAGTTGAVTEEHGTRDNLRAAIVENTLNDPKRHRYDVATMAKLATVQLFMSPDRELERTRATVTAAAAPSLHSVFPTIGDVSKPANFDQFVGTVHEVREREKIVAAKALTASGRTNLVPKQHRRLLKRGGDDVGAALEYLRKKSADPHTSFSFNTASYSATDRLDQRSLRRMDRAAGKGKPDARALSPPRRLPAQPTAFPF